MSDADTLASRLRQAVQGCTIHQHGPVQAWSAIEDAVGRGLIEREQVAALAIAASTRKLDDLRAEGVRSDDPRYRKEVTTLRFIRRILREDPPRTERPLDTFLGSVAIDRDAVLTSGVYSALQTIEHVRLFMEHHVFAVWDFMCLLKSLQRAVTCVKRIWRPVGDPRVRRLINEIVIAEESDVINGEVTSHFEMYLAAMREIGANTRPIESFMRSVEHGALVSLALDECGAPPAARDFVLVTIDIVNRDQPHDIAAAFTVGREQTIPGMFRKLVASLRESGHPCDRLLAYLDRHIAIDDGEHGPAALQLLEALCLDDEARWESAAATARRALRARRALWDAVSEQLG